MGGYSGGVGILVQKGINAGELPHEGAHRARWAPYRVAGKFGDGVLISVYGYDGVGGGPRNRALQREVLQWAGANSKDRVLIMGDWSCPPSKWTPRAQTLGFHSPGTSCSGK